MFQHMGQQFSRGRKWACISLGTFSISIFIESGFFFFSFDERKSVDTSCVFFFFLIRFSEATTLNNLLFHIEKL